MLLWKKFILFYFNQETEVAPKRTEDGPRYHIITGQTSVKMDSALTYNPDSFILDMTGSSDNNFEVREKSFLCFYVIFSPLTIQSSRKQIPPAHNYKRKVKTEKRNKIKWKGDPTILPFFAFVHVRDIFTYVLRFALHHTRL